MNRTTRIDHEGHRSVHGVSTIEPRRPPDRLTEECSTFLAVCGSVPV